MKTVFKRETTPLSSEEIIINTEWFKHIRKEATGKFPEGKVHREAVLLLAAITAIHGYKRFEWHFKDFEEVIQMSAGELRKALDTLIRLKIVTKDVVDSQKIFVQADLHKVRLIC